MKKIFIISLFTLFLQQSLAIAYTPIIYPEALTGARFDKHTLYWNDRISAQSNVADKGWIFSDKYTAKDFKKCELVLVPEDVDEIVNGKLVKAGVELRIGQVSDVKGNELYIAFEPNIGFGMTHKPFFAKPSKLGKIRLKFEDALKLKQDEEKEGEQPGL